MGGDGDACATDAHNRTGTCERTRRDPNVWVNSGQRITGLCSVLTSSRMEPASHRGSSGG